MYEYELVPSIEITAAPTLERRCSEAPSTISASSKASSCHVNQRRRHDRRKERLNTELLGAVQQNSYADVVRLLEGGASPNASCRPNRVSALHIAALRGDYTILRALISSGANCAIKDRDGRQAVHYAAWAGQPDALQLLLKENPTLVNAPVEPDTEPEHDIDCLDSWSHDHDSLNNLVPDAVDLKSTPLHLACKTVSFTAANLLLKIGADVTIKDAKGLTPLDVTGLNAPHHHEPVKDDAKGAAKNRGLEKNKPAKPRIMASMKLASAAFFTDAGETEDNNEESSDEKSAHKIVTALINNGARMPKGNVILKEGSVINQNKMSVTTLHTAVANEELGLIECLLKNGACMMTWNENGETALHLAVRKWLVEPLKRMLLWDSERSDSRGYSVVDVRDCHGRTPLHLAVMQEWPNGVALLLEAGADVATSSNDNETVLHLAAERGNKPMLEELLKIPDARKVLENRNSYYHTPLYRAVQNDHLLCVELLCKEGADTTIATPGDFTLLHMATSKNSPAVLSFLLTLEARKVKDVVCKEPKGGVSALHIAAKEGFTECARELITAGCNLLTASQATTDRGGTALHLAAEKGHLEVAKLIVKHDVSTLEARNSDDWQPLHIAAGFGRSDCVRHLLKSGADLSATVWDDTGRKSALDIIMYCVPQPVLFLDELFDSYLEVNEHPLNDPDCEVKLKYDILAPGDRCCKQLKVLNAILENGNQDLEQHLLLHPLTETFVHFKWRRLRVFFTFIMGLHVMLTLSLTIRAHLSYVEKGPSTILFVCSELARVGLFSALIPIIFVEIINASQLKRYYITDSESWVKWSVIVTSSIVGVVDPQLSWPRHIAAVSVLLAWIELLFLLARCPKWGFYVLMFSRVASNVFKVLATFTFLLLGFMFAFLIHFEAAQPFRNLLESFIKVLVMMLEFDYENMFEQFKEVTAYSVVGRLIFILFVILVAIVMMNLMVGLAVSDITVLETQGKTQRLAKQTAFLGLLELTVYNESLSKILPKSLRNYLQKMRAVPEFTIIKPASPLDSNKLKDIPKSIKESILNRVWSSHIQGEDDELTVSLHDINYKIDQLADVVRSNKSNDTSSASSSSSKTSSSSDSTILEKRDITSILEEILKEQKLIREEVQRLEERTAEPLRSRVLYFDQPAPDTQHSNYV